MPVCSGLTRLVRAGYSLHDSGLEQVGNMHESCGVVQDGSGHMQPSLPSSSYPTRSTLSNIATMVLPIDTKVTIIN